MTTSPQPVGQLTTPAASVEPSLTFTPLTCVIHMNYSAICVAFIFQFIFLVLLALFPHRDHCNKSSRGAAGSILTWELAARWEPPTQTWGSLQFAPALLNRTQCGTSSLPGSPNKRQILSSSKALVGTFKVGIKKTKKQAHLFATPPAGGFVRRQLFFHTGGPLHFLGVKGHPTQGAKRGGHLQTWLQTLSTEPATADTRSWNFLSLLFVTTRKDGYYRSAIKTIFKNIDIEGKKYNKNVFF